MAGPLGTTSAMFCSAEDYERRIISVTSSATEVA